ncbi:MAG: VPLPA-CTERM sorting domain-containing protein [Pseudomonadota bacterium]
MKSICRISALAIAVGMSTGSAQAITLTAFFDRLSFEAATDGLKSTTEDFEAFTTLQILTGDGNDIGSGVTLDVSPDANANFDASEGNLEDNGFKGDGDLEIEVNNGYMLDGTLGSVAFNFPGEVLGFGFDFNEIDGGSDTTPDINTVEVAFVLAGETFLMSDLLGLTTNGINSATELGTFNLETGFLGLLSDTPFSTVTLVHGDDLVPGGTSGSVESIDLANLTFVGEPSPIPLPAAGWLILAGVGALGAAKSGRRKA